MADGSEIVHYDHPGIPLYIRKGILSYYPGRRAQCHWHDDIELIQILDGEMNYYINGEVVPLRKGDGILINTREMHYGYSNHGNDCIFICILFHTTLLSPCKEVAAKYVTPFLSRCDLPYLLFSQKNTQDICNDILRIYEQKETGAPCYELNVLSILYDLWAKVNQQCTSQLADVPHETSADVLSLRKMVSYIHDHYKENITLHDIAAAGNICNSKCCAVFKKQVHLSPFEFLNHYRLQLSADLLSLTDKSITDIAIDCGFNHLSYYSKLFYRYYACTPREYRNGTRSRLSCNPCG